MVSTSRTTTHCSGSAQYKSCILELYLPGGVVPAGDCSAYFKMSTDKMLKLLQLRTTVQKFHESMRDSCLQLRKDVNQIVDLVWNAKAAVKDLVVTRLVDRAQNILKVNTLTSAIICLIRGLVKLVLGPGLPSVMPASYYVEAKAENAQRIVFHDRDGGHVQEAVPALRQSLQRVPYIHQEMAGLYKASGVHLWGGDFNFVECSAADRLRSPPQAHGGAAAQPAAGAPESGAGLPGARPLLHDRPAKPSSDRNSTAVWRAACPALVDVYRTVRTRGAGADDRCPTGGDL